MNELLRKEFDFNGTRLTTIIQENGAPLFIAKEVCEHLEISDTSMATRNLDEDEKLIQTLLVSGQNRRLTLITESGLYSLVIRSNKPEAKNFKKWITSEVLPSIRINGAYSVNEQFKIPQTFSEALKLAGEQAEVIEKQSLLITEQTPKVLAYDKVIDNKTTYTLASLADISGIGRTTVANKLREFGWMKAIDRNGTESTQYAKDIGYAKTIFDTVEIRGKEVKKKQFVLFRKGIDRFLTKI